MGEWEQDRQRSRRRHIYRRRPMAPTAYVYVYVYAYVYVEAHLPPETDDSHCTHCSVPAAGRSESRRAKLHAVLKVARDQCTARAIRCDTVAHVRTRATIAYNPSDGARAIDPHDEHVRPAGAGERIGAKADRVLETAHLPGESREWRLYVCVYVYV